MKEICETEIESIKNIINIINNDLCSNKSDSDESTEEKKDNIKDIQQDIDNKNKDDEYIVSSDIFGSIDTIDIKNF
jgi:hypothetical protein